MSKEPHKTAKVWRAIKDIDNDKNGFLKVDELELCFVDQFPVALDGKSLVYFFRRWSTDHDKDMVNYRLIKESMVSAMENFRTMSAKISNPYESSSVYQKSPLSKFIIRSDKISEVGSALRSTYRGEGPIKALQVQNTSPSKIVSGGGFLGGQTMSGLAKLNRFNVRTLNNQSLLPSSPDRRSLMSHSVS